MKFQTVYFLSMVVLSLVGVLTIGRVILATKIRGLVRASYLDYLGNFCIFMYNQFVLTRRSELKTFLFNCDFDKYAAH